MSEEVITVGELVEVLSKFPPDQPVYSLATRYSDENYPSSPVMVWDSKVCKVENDFEFPEFSPPGAEEHMGVVIS